MKKRSKQRKASQQNIGKNNKLRSILTNILPMLHLSSHPPIFISAVALKTSTLALSCSVLWLFATPWTVAHQTPLLMEFSRQEYWSGMPFPTPRDLPNSGIKPFSLVSAVLGADSLPLHSYVSQHCTEFYIFSWFITVKRLVSRKKNPGIWGAIQAMRTCMLPKFLTLLNSYFNLLIRKGKK